MFFERASEDGSIVTRIVILLSQAIRLFKKLFTIE